MNKRLKQSRFLTATGAPETDLRNKYCKDCGIRITKDNWACAESEFTGKLEWTKQVYQCEKCFTKKILN